MKDPRPGKGLLGGRREEIVAWGVDDAIAAADRTLERLRELDVRIPAENRLELSRRTVRRMAEFNVHLGPGDPTTERLLAESNRTIFEQYLIAKEIQSIDGGSRVRLERMLGGPLVPELGKHDPARDAQAEFFTAVLFYGAGFRVETGEPDLWVERWAHRFPVAVKRVTSPKNFSGRVREAKKQLQRAGKPGFIAISADQLLSERYHADRYADLSATHYDLISDWTDRLKLDHQSNPVVAVAGLSTSFRHRRGGSGQDLEFHVHFHHRFITWQEPRSIESVSRVGDEMAEALAGKLARLGRV